VMDKNLKIALILSATDKATAVLNRAFVNAERRSKSLERASKSVGDIGNKAIVSGGLMTAFFAKTIADARESEIAQRKLILGFQTMGSTARRAQEQIDFAGRMQFKWGVEDEDIMNVQGKLSTFKRAMNEAAMKAGVFQRATQAAFDMQAKGFGDAVSNITQLGKALQNPALGSMALAKAGAINKEDLPVIKAIQATKGVTAAQLFLLKAIDKQVKGTAEATADPLKVMELQFHETSEAIGKQLLPSVQKLAQKMADYLPKVISFVENHKRLILFAAKASVTLLAFGFVMKGVAFTMSGIKTLFTVSGFAIKLFSGQLALGSKIAIAAVRSYEALKFGLFAIQYAVNFSVLPALRAAGAAIMRFGLALLASPITWYIAAAVALAGVVYLIVRNWSSITGFFKRVWSGVVSAFRTSVRWITNYLLFFNPVGLVYKNWAPITHFFGNLWEGVKEKFTAFIGWTKKLKPFFTDIGKNIVGWIAKAIYTVAMAPVNAVLWIINKVRGILGMKALTLGGSDIGSGGNGQRRENAFAANMTRPIPVPVPAGRVSSNIHFNPEIHLNGSATVGDAKRISGQVREDFDRMMREHEANKLRRSF
jgi:hypothetical protein